MPRATLLLVFLLACGGARAAGDGLTPEQRRMKHCNGKAEAKELQGPQRNHFLVDCLKGVEKGDGRGLTLQQQRSETCNQAARERRMEGAERRGFLTGCSRPPVDKRPKDCSQRAQEMKELEAEDRLRFINGCVEGTKTQT